MGLRGVFPASTWKVRNDVTVFSEILAPNNPRLSHSLCLEKTTQVVQSATQREGLAVLSLLAGIHYLPLVIHLLLQVPELTT
jgi:hypothetical protein